jgi:coenzyme F420-0:L-glutamate ligase / coenzyme F420-1:gamma-L-glutamate ligase
VRGIPEVRAGDDVAALVAEAAAAPGGPGLLDGDVVVVASKVVAKAEGRAVPPQDGEDPDRARRRLALAHEVLVETPGVVVVRTPAGHVSANAGIDASNSPSGDLLLLPADADASAAALREALRTRLAGGGDVGVVVADTVGRAWREGQVDVALGLAGIPALRDERGMPDRDGRPLSVTLVAVADQLAGAADLVRDKAAGVPAVVVRGSGSVGRGDGRGADLLRPPAVDLFPHGRGWLARRLATGAGAPARPGPPTAEERALVAAAADGARWAGDALVARDGPAAGIGLACLLDLGYRAELQRGPGGYLVRVG